MEIKEAIGYLQAVADNAQSTPKYQQALEMAIQSMEQMSGMVFENKELRAENATLRTEVEELKDAIDDMEDSLGFQYEQRTLSEQRYLVADRERDTLKSELRKLEAELRDERDRFDKLSDFEVAEAQELAELRARIGGLEK